MARAAVDTTISRSAGERKTAPTSMGTPNMSTFRVCPALELDRHVLGADQGQRHEYPRQGVVYLYGPRLSDDRDAHRQRDEGGRR